MKNLKRTIAIVCVLSLMVNLLIVNAAGELYLDTEEMVISNRIPILTLALGNGEGQVGYGGSEQVGYRGPSSFAVEDGVIYVLDTLNKRIVVFENGDYSEISLEDCPKASHMMYQNGKLAVVDNNSGVTGVYTTDGTLVKLISHPEAVKNEVAAKIVEIGESYVIWNTIAGNSHGYDWEMETSTSGDASVQLKQNMMENEVYCITSTGEKVVWSVEFENRGLDPLGVRDGALVYQQYEYVPDVDMLFTELSIRRVMPDGSETYAVIDFSEWKAPALDPFYLATNGKVYVMECLEQGTVISEVVLSSSDVSQMDELYQQAEERLREVKAMEAGVVINSNSSEPSHVSTRTEVKNRALQMINYTWTVKASHKVKPSGYENQVIIPKCVQDAAVGSTFTGIPYCWGGCNGLDTLVGDNYTYTSFSDVVNAANKTAGNISSAVDYQTYGTIGVDCVGFVMSAYRFSGDKQVSGTYMSYGESISYDDLKPMDILAKSGHVMLYVSNNGVDYVTYEAYSGEDNYGNEIGGKTEQNIWSKAALAQRGYVARNLFCLTCNKNGGVVSGTASGHTFNCSECEYEWPIEAHDQSKRTSVSAGAHATTCSVCDYVWPDSEEAHNSSGEIVVNDTTHSQTCSICDYVWVASAHNTNDARSLDSLMHTYICTVCDAEWKAGRHNEDVLTRSSTGHTYTCSVCDFARTEAHTYVNNLCSECGYRKSVILQKIPLSKE